MNNPADVNPLFSGWARREGGIGVRGSSVRHLRMLDVIGRRIVSGELKPGDPLPNGAEWAAMLGVSRTAFRECIRVLAGKGLIDARPKTGMRVRPTELWNHLDPDVLAWRFDAAPDADASELFELRRVIEPAAAEFAAAVPPLSRSPPLSRLIRRWTRPPTTAAASRRRICVSIS